jgi:hypothetical protein
MLENALGGSLCIYMCRQRGTGEVHAWPNGTANLLILDNFSNFMSKSIFIFHNQSDLPVYLHFVE